MLNNDIDEMGWAMILERSRKFLVSNDTLTGIHLCLLYFLVGLRLMGATYADKDKEKQSRI